MRNLNPSNPFHNRLHKLYHLAVFVKGKKGLPWIFNKEQHALANISEMGV